MPLIHRTLALFTTLLPLTAHAVISPTGNYSGGNTPYNGTDDPWVTTNLNIGTPAGPGTLTITDGSAVNNTSEARIGPEVASSTSTVLISGPGSIWTNSSGLRIGFHGAAELSIVNGGSLTNTVGIIGDFSAASGSVTVGNGVGTSTWTNSLLIWVGNSGSGNLSINSGGAVSSATGFVGTSSQGSGTVSVGDDAGGPASWTTSGTLTVASAGTGVMDIVRGGAVSSGTGTIGNSNGSIGEVIVGDGTGAATASWLIAGPLTVGNTPSASGTLTLRPGGIVSAEALDGGNSLSRINLAGGTLQITSSDSTSNTIRVVATASTIDLPTPDSTFTINSPVTGNSRLTKTGPGTLALAAANTYSGGTTVVDGNLLLTGSVRGSLTVSSPATLAGTGSVAGPVTLEPGATLSPGSSIGALTTGGLLVPSTATFSFELDPTSLTADHLNVNGTVNLGTSATLDLSLLSLPATPPWSLTFLLLSNDSTDPITGQFASITGLPPSYHASLNYTANDGNDLSLTLLIPEPSSLLAACGLALPLLRCRK